MRTDEDGEQLRLCMMARVAKTTDAASSRPPVRIYRGHRLLVALGKEEAVALIRVCHSA
jgi:hypothetical protein